MVKGGYLGLEEILTYIFYTLHLFKKEIMHYMGNIKLYVFFFPFFLSI